MSQASDNLRIDDRKSLFVAATLHHADGFCSVKLRNVSPTGALVEAEKLPRSGTPVEIRRGPLVAMGTVIWKRGGKAGVEFLGQTDVSRWLPNGNQPSEKGFEVFKGTPSSAFQSALPSFRMTTKDVEVVALMLDDLFETFSNDAGVRYNYSNKLQALTVASEMLRALSSQARNGGG